jgi:alpha-galactosidase
LGAQITIIGAGSAVFSLSLIRDLCLTPSLSGSSVTLMDIDEDRLESINLLCTRYASEIGIDIRTRTTTDRRDALTGADFVVNTALVGNYDLLRKGWAIARQFGYRFGGSLHVMHDEAFWINFAQMRFFEDVIQDVLEICPDAWYLQVANPVLEGMTHLSRKYPDAKLVGLCHGYSGVYKIADVLGLERDRLSFEIPGVNHTVFLTHCYHDGKDVFPLLDKWIEEEAPGYWKTSGTSEDLGPQAIDLYRRFGVFPIGDTCTPGGGSWPWWYHTDAATEGRWKEDPVAWWERHFSRGLEKVAEINRAAHDRTRPVSEAFPPKHSGEVMVPMIDALANDTQRVLIGNIANRGDFVPGVPRDFAVEIPLLVSKRGIEGIRTLPLPETVISHILRDRVATVNLEIEAFITGNKRRLLELLQFDPWTSSIDQASKMLEAILAIPENAAMATHFAE